MADPIADIIGDYRAFAALQRDRLAARGIDIAPCELSHLATAYRSRRVLRWTYWSHSGTRTARWLSSYGAISMPRAASRSRWSAANAR